MKTDRKKPARLVSQQEAASLVGVSARTIRNWIANGAIRAWRTPGGRAVRVDPDELLAAFTEIPTVMDTQSTREGS